MPIRRQPNNAKCQSLNTEIDPVLSLDNSHLGMGVALINNIGIYTPHVYIGIYLCIYAYIPLSMAPTKTSVMPIVNIIRPSVDHLMAC